MAQEGGCQVLCVTHNLAFQQICDSVIQVLLTNSSYLSKTCSYIHSSTSHYYSLLSNPFAHPLFNLYYVVHVYTM